PPPPGHRPPLPLPPPPPPRRPRAVSMPRTSRTDHDDDDELVPPAPTTTTAAAPVSSPLPIGPGWTTTTTTTTPPPASPRPRAAGGEPESARRREHEMRREIERLTETLNALQRELASRDRTIQRLEAALEEARTPAATPDDLRRIRGIGPKLEARLHGLGIDTFAEIAAWTESDVTRLAPHLKVHPRRIMRDGWVASARALMPETTTTTTPPASEEETRGLSRPAASR
ncbi:MAG: hypothetical protein AAF928_18460, partial [Myxococcota bacterium]